MRKGFNANQVVATIRRHKLCEVNMIYALAIFTSESDFNASEFSNLESYQDLRNKIQENSGFDIDNVSSGGSYTVSNDSGVDFGSD